MANNITDETIEYVSMLAKLDLDGRERKEAMRDMSRMLDYIDKLNELDTTGVEPMSHVFSLRNVFREDQVTNGDESEATLGNAPEEKESMFVVPRSIE
ncbi:MAG: Asp-tRNA(Asn)/Glu-tRNA(Gln) amidotransferase subunit GatC [Butyrivibrio sp.]|nr:Asp-tRNA(Asn)/Glu-tRNA(Gln) amidotransferase subunit GatC [Acetatifactor muris]MCM1559710.1 Asp-tRNA(Asn)/Glu-tRNA(Gln) amidotransferase subunit GatC [Butyrivibrio sp.]